MLRKEMAAAVPAGDGGAAAPAPALARLEAASDDVLYKIDIPANRYDMLCLEGIARALNIFSGRAGCPDYRLAPIPPASRVTITVKAEVALVRPFIVGAVLRGVSLDAARLASCIDLQDRLHTNLCRHRSLVAIGTHDLGNLTPPFTYEALPPGDVRFVPLKQEREWAADALLAHYAANDLKLKRFVPLLAGAIVVPVVLDANREVASLPPVINGARSALTVSTRDIFIECTGTDLRKCRTVLATVVAALAEHCATPFEAEPVDVVDAFGAARTYPDLAPRELDVDAAEAASIVGVDLPPATMASLLSRMGLGAAASARGDVIRVRVPPTRSDVLHACDVAEDVAIAHGYNNVPPRVPALPCFGGEAPLNALCERLRPELAHAGWTEILTWALGPACEAGPWLRRPAPAAAVVKDAATAEFEVVRPTLLPGALRTLAANRDAPLPVRLFEVGDVVLLDRAAGTGLAGGRWGDAEPVVRGKGTAADAAPPAPLPPCTPPPHANGTGATNARRLVAVVCGADGGFEAVHGLLNRVMQVLGVPPPPHLAPALGAGAAGDAAAQAAALGGGYSWEAASDPAFFPGRHARVVFRGAPVGVFGVVHPDAAAAFGVDDRVVAALELDLEPFCFDQAGKALRTHLDVHSVTG